MNLLIFLLPLVLAVFVNGSPEYDPSDTNTFFSNYERDRNSKNDGNPWSWRMHDLHRKSKFIPVLRSGMALPPALRSGMALPPALRSAVVHPPAASSAVAARSALHMGPETPPYLN